MSAKRKRKITIVSVILLVVVIGGTVAIKANGKDKKPPESPVKTGKAEIAGIQVKVTEVGTVEPEVKVIKSAPCSIARSNASIELSGASADTPRCAITLNVTVNSS